MKLKVVSNKLSFGKKGFKYFIGNKDAKKVDLYLYFSHKWVHVEQIFMKLNIYLFKSIDKLLEKYNEIWED